MEKNNLRPFKTLVSTLCMTFKPICHLAFSFFLRWQLRPMQINLTCNTNILPTVNVEYFRLYRFSQNYENGSTLNAKSITSHRKQFECCIAGRSCAVGKKNNCNIS